MDVADLPPLTGSLVLDPWRIRLRLELAGELELPEVRRQQQATRSELLLWALLEDEPPGWEREYSTGLYRLDFYCPSARLAVEVDGGSHYGREAAERDALRDDWHRARGITTKRYSASEVEREPAWVLREIHQLLGTAAPVGERALGADDAPPQRSTALLGEVGATMAAQMREVVAALGQHDSVQEARIEEAFAEACRTVLPKHQSLLRQLRWMMEP